MPWSSVGRADHAPSALKHGLDEGDIIHAYRNPVRLWELGDGFAMIVGPNHAALFLEISYVDGEQSHVIVHAMSRSWSWPDTSSPRTFLTAALRPRLDQLVAQDAVLTRLQTSYGPILGLDSPKMRPLRWVRGHGTRPRPNPKGRRMSKQFMSCPHCASDNITTTTAQVRCRRCGWKVKAPDPRHTGHVQELTRAGHIVREPITGAIDELPEDFGELLTTTLSALPASHPAHESWPSLTAAEFRNRREEFGLSAEWLADRLGVALKTVQRWENGHRPIPQGVVDEMDQFSTATGEGAARECAESLLKTPDAVMMIPRTGIHFGFPASWYRALVDSVRDILMNEYGDEGRAAACFRVVYFDEVEDQK